MLHTSAPESGALVLALDTGSPRVSLALGREGEVLLEKDFAQSSASELLLAGVAAALAELGVAPGDLGGVVALAGPGSFTGLRVGMATAYGLHQALRVPAMARPSFEALAETAADRPLVAVVDALRGQWFAQRFQPEGGVQGSLGSPELFTRAEVWALAPAWVVGFGAEGALGGPEAPAGFEVRDPPPLAGAALALAARWQGPWDAATLVEPLYLRPPAVTIPVRKAL